MPGEGAPAARPRAASKRRSLVSSPTTRPKARTRRGRRRRGRSRPRAGAAPRALPACTASVHRQQVVAQRARRTPRAAPSPVPSPVPALPGRCCRYPTKRCGSGAASTAAKSHRVPWRLARSVEVSASSGVLSSFTGRLVRASAARPAPGTLSSRPTRGGALAPPTPRRVPAPHLAKPEQEGAELDEAEGLERVALVAHDQPTAGAEPPGSAARPGIRRWPACSPASTRASQRKVKKSGPAQRRRSSQVCGSSPPHACYVSISPCPENVNEAKEGVPKERSPTRARRSRQKSRAPPEDHSVLPAARICAAIRDPKWSDRD
jgi:hypothetical protein